MTTTATAPAVPTTATRGLLSPAVIVAALGYFVDIYDLILFNIVRVPSLTALGVRGDALVTEGLSIINWQMAGMLLGGVAFGVLGDKKGRLHILFGSITLYSLATIANGFVADLEVYRALRFVAGVGLAGELGAGVTLVAELLPARLRGYGTMVVASVGVSGAVMGNLVAKLTDWRVAYFVGGGLGLMLLVLRIGVRESHLFDGLKGRPGVARGDFFALFAKGDRLVRYLAIILVGVPIWFANAILVALAPEFARFLHVTGPVSAGDAVMLFYSGLVVGDLSSGLLSQYLKSRRKVIVGFVLALSAGIGLYLTLGQGASPAGLLALIGLLGLSSGYWAIFVTVGAEQFGTNIRATVATTVPNFVRGLVPVLTIAFQWTRPTLGLLGAAACVGGVCLVVALLAALTLHETFGKDLDFIEE
jgi:MFS transporter, putative metabolite:H+ symporter